MAVTPRGELGLDEELARLERARAPRSSLGRHRLCAGDLGGAGLDAVLQRPPIHVEDDRRAPRPWPPCGGDVRLPVALLAEEGLDPRFGVFEQIFVDGSLALDGTSSLSRSAGMGRP